MTTPSEQLGRWADLQAFNGDGRWAFWLDLARQLRAMAYAP